MCVANQLLNLCIVVIMYVDRLIIIIYYLYKMYTKIYIIKTMVNNTLLTNVRMKILVK